MSYTLNKRITLTMIIIMILSLLIPLANINKANAQEASGKLTIYKFEQEPGAKNPEGNGTELDLNAVDGELLNGVEFTIKQTHKYDPNTDKWSEVSDGYTKTAKTENGKVTFNFDASQLGRYTVQETDGPPEVVLNDTEYTVDIPMTNAAGTDLNYDVFVYPKNELVKAGVTLQKIDGDTKAALAGVVFELFDHEDNKIGEYTTGQNGKITVDDLAYGKYYFVEKSTIAPYLLNQKKVAFEIKTSDAGKIVDAKTLDNYKEPTVEKTVSQPEVNRGDVVTYTISVDMPSNIKEYEKFTVTDSLHENLEYQANSANAPAGFTFNYDENSRTLTWKANKDSMSDVKSGQVDFTFDAVISDDAEVNASIDNEATIDFDNSYDTGSNKDNTPITPHAGTLNVQKQDGKTGAALAGAEFELTDKTDNVVATGVSGQDGKVNFTATDANYDVNKLNYGDYLLTETKAPSGYNKLKNPIDVLINSEKNEIKLTVDNYNSDWNLPQTGGMGTLFFTLIGLGLMGIAAYLYMTRRKKENA